MCEGKNVAPGDLGLPSSITVAELEPLKEVRRRVEREHIRNALVNRNWNISQRNWNISQVAEELGVSRPTLHGLIKKYRIEREG
jgi:two-component system NtrC family response regulator